MLEKQNVVASLVTFWEWFITPIGFLSTIYGLNIVAWGGMLFLLLCNAAPAMCQAPESNTLGHKHLTIVQALALPGPYHHDCDDLNSLRRIWIEIDSQILNALFCVTGIGLMPWRLRGLYHLLRWRTISVEVHGMEKKLHGLRILAGIHHSWFRLPGSDTVNDETSREYLHRIMEESPGLKALSADCVVVESDFDPRVVLPIVRQPCEPHTGNRASPTKSWKLDLFVWCFVANSVFQCCLCSVMVGLNRYNRPPWLTGLLVGLACLTAAYGGYVSFKEGRRVKKIEIGTSQR